MNSKKLHPNQDFFRNEWKNLNGKWDFSFEQGKYNKKINVPYPFGSPLSGIPERDKTHGYYRKKVKWFPKNKRIFLCFGAVDYFCSVKVNGVFLGTHQGGYSKFEFEVTNIWHRDLQNTIEVFAEDKAEDSQTYGKQGYGDAKGIWQTVFLESRPESYIKDFKINTKLDGTVTFDINTCNCHDGAEISLYFRGNRSKATIYNNKAIATLNVQNPVLWCPETPKLYYGTVSLSETEDVVHTYFGIREVGRKHFTIENQEEANLITLNDRPIFISAFLDQSYNPQGFFTLPSDEDCEKEILRVKNVGFNAIRIHIKAEEPLKLYYADKHGIMVLEDIPCFWGEPKKETRSQFEKEMFDQVNRDYNHPAVIYWIIFNETWGLYSKIPDEKGDLQNIYTEDTAKWVVKCYHSLKHLDSTRLIEDNSPCHNDHTITDVNTWHFYTNGYEKVKNEIASFVKNNLHRSTANYKEGFSMGDVPLMNSECGNYWGIKGNAGESDISYQYKYMINEFRRHGKMNGYVFTEFHDVINEFNGFYRLNNDAKIFGYDAFGTSLTTLNKPLYVGADFPPVSSLKEGENVKVPIFASNFLSETLGCTFKLNWRLWGEKFTGGKKTFETGEFSFIINNYGTTNTHSICFTVPSYDGPATLSFELVCQENRSIISSNYVQFDFCKKEQPKSYLEISPLSLMPNSTWDNVVSHAFPEKISGIGSGTFTILISPEKIPNIWSGNDVKIYLEASSRFPMKHDFPDSAPEIFGNLMLGYAVDPGKNSNTFPQTDGETFPGLLKISVDGTEYGSCTLPDCPADSRGYLSHFYQEHDDELCEAGSYGYICSCSVPNEIFFESMLGKPILKEQIKLSFSVQNGSGLSIFGRKAGRYGMGIRIMG